jgi:hypothetical protein
MNKGRIRKNNPKKREKIKTVLIVRSYSNRMKTIYLQQPLKKATFHRLRQTSIRVDLQSY